MVSRQFKKLVKPRKKGPASARETGSVPSLDNKRYISATAHGQPYCVEVDISGTRFQAMIDSGAEGNFMSPAAAAKGWIALQAKAEPYEISAIDGRTLQTAKLETEECVMKFSGHIEKIQFDITPIGQYDIILGIPWLKSHDFSIRFNKQYIYMDCRNCEFHKSTRIANLVEYQEVEASTTANPEKSSQTIGAMSRDVLPVGIPREYQRYHELFTEGLPETALPQHQPWDHEIPLEVGKQPRFGPLYSLSEPKLKALREYLEGNLKKGFIRESQSPAGHPILFIEKKDGSLWLCVDYRALNEIAIKNRYALPLISELQDRVMGATIFTKLDLMGAYNLIRMKVGEEWKTTFRTRYGHYEYIVMLFGLTNAPGTFQALINNVLRPHLDKFVMAYLDDILIYSKNKKEHVIHIHTVLKALEEYQLKVHTDKSVFHQESVEFLGYIVSSDGLKMQPQKVQSVVDWPALRNVKDVQQFLGLANYYRRFIQGFSGIVAPLTELTKKDTPFHWGPQEQGAFEEIKRRFTTGPILATFDPEKPSTVETDASDFAIGACLSQPNLAGKLHPIAFYSRKFSGAEINYDIHDKELLAIVASFKEWRVYLEGAKHKIQVFTDHKNLLYFTSTKELNRR